MKYCIRVIRRFGSFIKRHYVILLAFLLPVLILEIAYAFNGIYPFGKRDVLIIDFYHQYAPFISDLQDKLRSFSSMLYSWSGFGINYLPLFAYYLASPLNLITLLFPKDCLAEAMLVLTLLKIGLSGACFSFYLKSVHDEKNMVTVAFSMLYALSGFVLVFSWNIMWMDAIYLLPLIMLGLVRLVRDGRGLFFCITLTSALLTNFYIAVFICIFLVLYYPVLFFKYHSIKSFSLLIKRTAKFAGYSLLSAGISAVLLLPTFVQLKLTSAANDMFPKTLASFFDLFDYITRNFTAAPPSIREGMPNLYSGIVVLILIPIYFLSRSIRLKEKLLNLCLMAVLILSFNLNVLNFIWNGFHYPNQIPYRFSFVFIFIVLSMSYEGYKKLNEFSGRQIGTICLMILGLVLISQKFDGASIEFLTVYISAAFVILYAVSLTIDRSSKVKPFSIPLIFALVVAAEMMTNTMATTVSINYIEGYSFRDGYSSGTEVSQIRDEISSIKAEDKGFYRMEILPPQTVNDPSLYNYRGLSLFSSTAPAKPVRMLQNLGFGSNGINSYTYRGSTPVLDSIFGIKYLIYRSMSIDEKLYKRTASTDELAVFTNPYALPLGFLADDKLNNFRSFSINPFVNQNTLMEDICGVKDILLPAGQKLGMYTNLSINGQDGEYSFTRMNKGQDSTARVQFTVDGGKQYYIYYKAPYNVKGSAFVTIGDKKIEFNSRDSGIIDIGFCQPKTSVQLQVTFDKTSNETGNFQAYACSLDQSAFEDAISKINENSMTVESFTDTDIKGAANTSRNGLMVLSMPYDKSWNVKVDNQEVKTQAVDECLLSFEIPKGKHSIELTYYPEGLYAGIAVSLVSVFVLIFIIIYKSGIISLRHQTSQKEA